MAYNAGEYRVLQSMRKAGMNAQNAKPSALPGLSPVTHAYVEKLHALACVLEDVEDQPGVMASLDRTVPVLKDHTLPAGTSIQQWAAQRAWTLRDRPPQPGPGRRQPCLGNHPGAGPGLGRQCDVDGNRDHAGGQHRTGCHDHTDAAGGKTVATIADRPRSRRHTVRDGESAWTIARRYGMPVKALLSLNGLSGSSVLKPGAVLRVED